MVQTTSNGKRPLCLEGLTFLKSWWTWQTVAWGGLLKIFVNEIEYVLKIYCLSWLNFQDLFQFSWLRDFSNPPTTRIKSVFLLFSQSNLTILPSISRTPSFLEEACPYLGRLKNQVSAVARFRKFKKILNQKFIPGKKFQETLRLLWAFHKLLGEEKMNWFGYLLVIKTNFFLLFFSSDLFSISFSPKEWKLFHSNPLSNAILFSVHKAIDIVKDILTVHLESVVCRLIVF